MNVLASTSIGTGFDSVFTEISTGQGLNLKNNNCLRLFCLDVSNNKFSYSGLHQFLQRNIGRYVFSRATIEQFIEDGDSDAIGLKAVELLRQASNPKDTGAGGELGEILLYLFLEQKLNAPKLLSKVELKTTKNQYVFGSDGVHLLTLGDKAFQLVLGESKIVGKLESAVDDAFASIKKVSNDASNEIRLIEKNILSESFDDETTELIKSIIVPTKRDQSIVVDNAFGIFLGYSIGIDAIQYSNAEFRDAINDKLKNDINNIATYIEKKVNESGLAGYSFYFYILPFNNALQDRAAIIQKLKGEK
ncbi:MAG: DUF1837 domain-containing protein [Ruminococcaceae bacterium]|nr:DUF1837 domain-containing protein [Oscillospiraceae bacterium]